MISFSRFVLKSKFASVVAKSITQEKLLPLLIPLCHCSKISNDKMVESQNKPFAAMVEGHRKRLDQQNEFMAEKTAEFEIGKEHLANMMGIPAGSITQEEIDDAISYLLPSGLFQKMSRPMMKPATLIYKEKVKIAFDDEGKPFSTFFYTGKPEYFKLMKEITAKGILLDRYANAANREAPSKSIAIIGTNWIPQRILKSKLREQISEENYKFFLESMERLLNHPYSYKIEPFIHQMRSSISFNQQNLSEQVSYDDRGVPFCTYNSYRKTSKSSVTVYGNGSGEFEVNGKDITYFQHEMDREQIFSPLLFSDMVKKVDVVATVEGGGHSSQAGAIRHALSKALTALVDEAMAIRMNLAGLLTPDRRNRERVKYGRRGARAKYIWRKR